MRTAILKNLEQLIKDPLILITTRAANAALLHSIYSQSIRLGRRSSFKEFYNNYTDHWRKVFDYQSIYDECVSIFGNENVFLLPQGLLRANPRSFFQLLESRLGMSPFDQIKSEAENRKLTSEQILFYRTFWPILSKIASLRGNQELPPYFKNILFTHSPIMDQVSRKLGRLGQLGLKVLHTPNAHSVDDALIKSILDSFTCYVSAMESLPQYSDYSILYKNPQK